MEDVPFDIDFDKTFKIMLFGMRANKSHPDLARNKKWLCQFVMMHGTFFFVLCILIYSTIFHDLKKNDYTQACANGILSIVFTVVTFKYCVMLRYQPLLKSLMDEMKLDYEAAKSLSFDEQRVILTYSKRGKSVVILWLAISICAGGLFLVKTVFLMTYYSLRGEFKLVHLYDVTYPSPVEEMKNELGVYFVLFALFLFYDCYAMIMYIAMASLGPIFMLHASGQLDIVIKRLKGIFDEKPTEKPTLKRLIDIVKHLQKIYSFLDRVMESFKILYELTLRATAIILPISFYQVIESFRNGELRIEFITVIIGAISLSSIPCYYSDKLMDKGEEVRLAVYMCGWEAHLNLHERLTTTLLLIHLRAARPVAIRTLFRTVSLNALTDVYHQAYAIFNLLNATWN